MSDDEQPTTDPSTPTLREKAATRRWSRLVWGAATAAMMVGGGAGIVVANVTANTALDCLHDTLTGRQAPQRSDQQATVKFAEAFKTLIQQTGLPPDRQSEKITEFERTITYWADTLERNQAKRDAASFRRC